MRAALLAWIARAVSGARVRYAAAIADAGPRVFFANHSSHLDFLVVWSSLPRAVRKVTRPVAADDYWSRDRCAGISPGRFSGRCSWHAAAVTPEPRWTPARPPWTPETA